MLRTLFALLLAAATAGVFAAEPLPSDAPAPQCEKQTAQAAETTTRGNGSAETARPGTPAPVRPRSASGRSTPRWHSLLPGMIR